MGLPHRRVEEFKYTDLRALMREIAPFAATPSATESAKALAKASAFADVDALQVCFVNGHLVRETVRFDALPEGVEIVPLAEALASGHEWLARLSPVAWAKDNPVYQLNSSFMADGVMLRIAGALSKSRFICASSHRATAPLRPPRAFSF